MGHGENRDFFGKALSQCTLGRKCTKRLHQAALRGFEPGRAARQLPPLPQIWMAACPSVVSPPLPRYNRRLRRMPMPLRDHFHSPVNDTYSWDEVHGGWPVEMVRHL